MSATEIAMLIVAGVTIVGGVTWVAYLSRQSTEQAKLNATTAVTLRTVAERVREVGDMAAQTRDALEEHIREGQKRRIAELERELAMVKGGAG